MQPNLERPRLQYPQVLVLGYSAAEMYLQKPNRGDVNAVIAIHGQREFAVDFTGIPNCLDLQFDDSEAPRSDDLIHAARISLRQKRAAEIGLIHKPPTADDVSAIIDFAQSIRSIDGVLLCHCRAGISRSPAAALICLASWTGPGSETYCVRQIRNTQPHALPHRDVVRFGDDLLGRGGKLLAATDRLIPY